MVGKSFPRRYCNILGNSRSNYYLVLFLGQCLIPCRILQKIHAFTVAKRDGNRIRNFFRLSENATSLNDCKSGLQQALDVFGVCVLSFDYCITDDYKVQRNTAILRNVGEMRKNAEKTHEELLDLISALSDGTNSDGSSLVCSLGLDSSGS